MTEPLTFRRSRELGLLFRYEEREFLDVGKCGRFSGNPFSIEGVWEQTLRCLTAVWELPLHLGKGLNILGEGPSLDIC